jgi:hypothetical protein
LFKGIIDAVIAAVCLQIEEQFFFLVDIFMTNEREEEAMV